MKINGSGMKFVLMGSSGFLSLCVKRPPKLQRRCLTEPRPVSSQVDRIQRETSSRKLNSFTVFAWRRCSFK